MIIDLDPPDRDESLETYEGDIDERELAPVIPLPVTTSKATPEPAPALVAAHTYCLKCNQVLAPYYAKCPTCTGEKNRLQVDRLRDVIRELKESIRGGIDPDRERELLKLLDLYQHPDTQGFVMWLAAQREQASSAPQKGRRR